ncbi:hypothetical protein CC78DRAFT_582844 [Lojkania enalia]|uniref:Uncharacterized protein n=1 Tax=Lojkania enalia TaxID=147567 RepID=A0A9P4N7J7_9PLEO|nr:hypothetical protein CC78DRAFT_582844 [Didymosphaeria enalia]
MTKPAARRSAPVTSAELAVRYPNTILMLNWKGRLQLPVLHSLEFHPFVGQHAGDHENPVVPASWTRFHKTRVLSTSHPRIICSQGRSYFPLRPFLARHRPQIQLSSFLIDKPPLALQTNITRTTRSSPNLQHPSHHPLAYPRQPTPQPKQASHSRHISRNTYYGRLPPLASPVADAAAVIADEH